MTGQRGDIGVRDWLAARLPAPPQALVDRLVTIVGDERCNDKSELPRLLIANAGNLLRGLGDDRSAAIDLLAADALMTYAMEAAAETGMSVEAIATDAMHTIAVLASSDGNAREQL